MICPVTPDEDCPVKWLVGGLFFLVLCAAGLLGLIVAYNYARYGQWRPPGHYAAPEHVTPEKETN